MYTDLEKRVIECISLKQEGGSWDYKKMWHTSKSDLLHDIICMSNMVGQDDGIIIIGCDEENGHQLVDVSTDPNRKNTSQLVVFLRDKHFAAGSRPITFVHSMTIEDKVLDIIVVKNTRNTPYYLSEQFEGVRAHHIYTRVMDTNTPKDKSADPDRVEKLWRKRFALDATAIDKAQYLLQTPDDWTTIDGDQTYYCKSFPEFTIVVEPDDRDGYEYYLFNQMDIRPRWYNIHLKYHHTTIYTTLGIALDGARYLTPCPNHEYFYDNKGEMVLYKAFTKGTLRFDLNYFFYKHEKSGEEDSCRRRFFECVPVFSSDVEKKQFEAYATSHYLEASIPDHYHIPVFPKTLPNGQLPSAFEEDFIKALKIQNLLEAYRSE